MHVYIENILHIQHVDTKGAVVVAVNSQEAEKKIYL